MGRIVDNPGEAGLAGVEVLQSTCPKLAEDLHFAQAMNRELAEQRDRRR